MHDFDTAHHTETDTGVEGIRVFAKTAPGAGTNNDFGFWHPRKDGTQPTWTYNYRIRFVGEETITRADAHDYIPIEKGNVDNDVTNSANLGRQDLSVSTGVVNYLQDEGQIHFPDAFILAGKVSLTKIEGSDPGRYFDAGAGCRRLTFSNGIDEFETDWLGIGDATCDLRATDGAPATVSVIADPDFSEGHFTEHMALWNYSSDPSMPMMLQYTRGHTIGGTSIGTTESADFVFPEMSFIREDQNICGVSWYR